MSQRRLAPLLAMLAVVLASRAAAAYPHYQQSSGSSRCGQCHVSRAGGGLLTLWGQEEGGELDAKRLVLRLEAADDRLTAPPWCTQFTARVGHERCAGGLVGEPMDKPRLFLGSSGKQEKLLQALTRGLSDIARVELPADAAGGRR